MESDARTSTPDLRLYLIAEVSLVTPDQLERAVAAAVRGGVTIVQLRHKGASTLQLVELGRRLLGVARAAGVPLVINDRVDVALAIGADGVHVGHPGKEDMPPELCRRLLGPSAIIGVSVDQEHEARAAEAAGASYISAGPIYATATKSDAGPAAGPALIRRLRGASGLPLLGIGGITAENAGAVITAGADGMAVASSVLVARDPESAARALRVALDSGGGRNGQRVR